MVSRSSHLKFSNTGHIVSGWETCNGIGKRTGTEEAFLGESVTENSKGKVAHCAEDNDQREVHLERIDVVMIEIAIKPADNKVIGERQEPRSPNGVICPNVSHDSYFRS